MRLGPLIYQFASWAAIGVAAVGVYVLIAIPKGLPDWWLIPAQFAALALVIWLIGIGCQYMLRRTS